MTEINSYSIDFYGALGGVTAQVENGKITATTEHRDKVMWLELTDAILIELLDIDRRCNYGGNIRALQEALELMRRYGARWRDVRSEDWWLEAFEENVRNWPENYTKDMQDLESFRSSFSAYRDAVQDGADEGPGDELPSEAALQQVWSRLRAEAADD